MRTNSLITILIAAALLLDAKSVTAAPSNDEAMAAEIKTSLLARMKPTSIAHVELTKISPKFLVETFRDRANAIFTLDDPTTALNYYEQILFNGYPQLVEVRQRELTLIEDAFSNVQYIAGTKSFTFGMSFPTMVKPFEQQIEQLVQARLQSKAAGPVRFRILGIGPDSGEFEMVVETLARILKRIAPGREAATAKQLNFRFDLYDRRNDILESAEWTVKALEKEHAWLKGRTFISFTDLVKDQLFAGWGEQNTAAVFCRNSMRDMLVDHSKGFMNATEKALLDGGIFVTDYLASTAMMYRTGLGKIGTFGLDSSEEEAFMFKKFATPASCIDAILGKADSGPGVAR